MPSMKYFMTLLVLPLLALGCSPHHRMGPHGYGGGEYAVSQAKEEVEALIARTIKDPQRAKEVGSVMEEITEEVKKIGSNQRQGHQQLYKLNENYQATPEEFLKVLDEVNNKRMQSSAKILSLRFKMKEMMSEQEWKGLTDGMEEMRNRYRSRHHGAKKSNGPSY